MARIELEFGDDGEVVGQTPAEIDALFKRIEAAALSRGKATGIAEAAVLAKKQIADNVAAELARREALAPLEKEKYARIDEENTSIKKQLLELSSSSDRTLKSREEAHARELLARADAITKREGRIRDQVKENIRGLAIAAGAREESLTELEVILGASIGYDDDMTPFVKDADGQVATLHGKPLSVAAYVKEYLDSHSHHRRPASGQGGGARGGATFGGTGQPLNVDAAKARITREGMSPTAINDLYEATRAKRSA
jgi:hypothetical protein